MIDGLRAVAFSKDDVEAFATANGYTDYEVKFAFIPVGSDGSLDYAITFTDTIDITDTIVGKTSFAEFVDAEETKIYTIAPTEDATWVFTSASYGNTYAYLCDSEGNTLTQNDIGEDGNNFKITYDLKAGETYTLKVKWYYVYDAGYMNLLFAPMN